MKPCSDGIGIVKTVGVTADNIIIAVRYIMI